MDIMDTHTVTTEQLYINDNRYMIFIVVTYYELNMRDL